MTPDEYKARSRGFSQDMSAEAIARRLQIAADLYSAWKYFGRKSSLVITDKQSSPQPHGAGDADRATL